ncbi:hypothetical protein OG555_12865 [Kribbella sp. NBC_01484]|uniref:hypothetical protein n=1 Tax=Kribbella sp. NBC_01484 TaxID=2903579 RepID=UPI002E37750E|nr:hypothetical protein [Kribbella sp. NBC_01484]
MDYDAFDVELRRVLDAATARSLDEATLAAEVDRLRELATLVEPAADRRLAGSHLMSLEQALSYEPPPLSDELAEAIRVQSRAQSADGAPTERIEHLTAAIAQIGRIADAASPADHPRILDLNEPLSILLESLRLTTPPSPDR